MYRAIAPLAGFMLFGAALAGQGGSIHGTVRDEQGVPIARAEVGIVGTTVLTATDAAGRYHLTHLPMGTVHLRVAAVAYTRRDTTLVITGGDSTVDFRLAFSPLTLPPVPAVIEKLPHFGERPATSVAQVSEQDLNRRAVTTVDEAVDHVPGIQFVNGQINIRGSTGYIQGLNSRVLLTVDGVPMNQGDRGGIDWDLLAVDEVESVDILKGAGSSLYGSAALGGCVNLPTRDIANGLHSRLRLTGGAYADPPYAVWKFRDTPGMLGSADLGLSYGNDVAGGRVAVGDRHSDGYRQQDHEDHFHVAGKARWTPTPGVRLVLSGALAVNRYDVPLSWCTRSSGSSNCDDRGQAFQPFLIDTTERGARTDSRKKYVAAELRNTISPQFAWQARASWLRTHFVDRRSTSDYGIGDRFGTEARLESHPDTNRSVLVGGEATLSRVTSDIFGGHTQAEIAAYGQSEQKVGVVRLSGGARLDFLAVDGGSLTAVASPRIGITVPTDRFEHDGGVARASIGRGFRAPTMAERFVHTFALGFEVIPNPNLHPETAWSLEIGHTTAPLLHMVRVDAALFWTEARDLIEPTLVLVVDSITGDATPKIQLQNLARARIAGLDATVLAAPIPNRLTASLGYTYLSTRRQLAGDSTTGPLAFRPRHMLTAGADYTLSTLDVGADFRFASRPERIELEGFVDPRRVPVKVLDLRAGWSHGPLELRLLAANALNYIYNLVPETLAPVRTITLTAVWKH